MKARQMIGFMGAGVIGIGILTFTFCTEKIKPGYAGVVYSMSQGIKGDVLLNGRKLVMPWQDLTQYSISTEQAFLSADKREGSKDDDSFNLTSKDGKSVNVDMQYSYRFDIERVPEIFKRFKGKSGKEIEQTFIRANAKVYANEAMSKFSIMDAYGEKRSDLNAELFNVLKEQFAKDGIVIESASFMAL
ncbi:SPFH domain-containing protein, partial [Cetobacterium sp.]|uniref:SPFH domain-containing protein n=1 Tax=Cetobacterium sp. TaxID=2071632 RepID=UPI003EE5FB50